MTIQFNEHVRGLVGGRRFGASKRVALRKKEKKREERKGIELLKINRIDLKFV